jgi:hypothetical protein
MFNFKSTSTGVNTIYTSTTTKGSTPYVLSSTAVPTFNYDVEVTKLFTDLKDRKGVEVRTSTLFDKYEELTSTYTKKDFDYLSFLSNDLWKPTNLNDLELTINEINSLKPMIVVAQDVKKWVHIRRMISTMSYSKGVGRNIKFYVIDEVTGKILGVVELSSDFGSLGVRDRFIGWTEDNRYNDKKLGHTAVGSTIVAVQPFGHNFLGGKLMSMLLTSQVVRDEWERRYEQKLVGITTTSLYGNNGNLTQYDGMEQWINLGETTGKTFIKPSDKVYSVWKNWLKVNYAEEYQRASTSSGPKQKVIQLIFRKLGLKAKDFHHGYRRGVYFSKFYNDSLEFLKGNTTEVGAELFDSSIDGLVKSWKKRAIRRFKTIFKKDEVKKETTFYSEIVNLTWEQTLFNYLGIRKETLAPLKTKSVKGFISDTVFNVFLSNCYTRNAKPNLVEIKTKVNIKMNIYFPFVKNYQIETMYFTSFIRL